MDLDTWMTKHEVVDDRLAVALGYSRPYINRVRNGLVNISLEAALKIWEYTAKEIDIYQLLPRLKRPGMTPPVISAIAIGTAPLPPIAKPTTSATKKPIKGKTVVTKLPIAKPAKPSLKRPGFDAIKPPVAAKAAVKPKNSRKPPVRKASRPLANA